MTQTMTPSVQAGQPVYSISDDDKKRQLAIQNAWLAYHGDLEPPLEKMENQANDNVLSNRCKAVVRRGAAFLFGKEVEITCEKGGPQEAQDLLDTTWGIKEQRIPLLLRLAMNGAMSGCAFLRIVPGRKRGMYRLVEIDPSIVFVQTAAQDCQTVVLFCLEYSVTVTQNNQPTKVFYREEIARIDPLYNDDNQEDALASAINEDVTWSIQHWTRIGEKGLWTAAGSPIIWPHVFAPIFHCQNLTLPNDTWGEPDIAADLIQLNNALNLTLSNANRDGKMNAAPIIYATGTGEQIIDVQPGKIIGLPLTESKIIAVPINAAIPDLLAIAADFRSDIDELTGVPGVATGRMKDLPRGNVAGIVIQLMHSPLLNKTEEKRCTYGKLILDASQALLALNGMDPTIKITLAWQNPLPEDALLSAQSAQAQQLAGVSVATSLRGIGFDPEEEEVLNQEEAAEKLAAQQALPLTNPVIPGQPVQPGQPPTNVTQPAQHPTMAPMIGAK